jgi:sarcosine oxidase subunit alpha
MARAGPTGARFDGRPLDARPSETLVQTLARQGLPTLQRSIRYHRPRAPYCGIGACTSCLVRVNGVPNVRACQYVPGPGDRIETENSWPSPRNDLLGVLDTIFSRGLDTLHGFRRPRFATPLYHRVVRSLAGYGRLPDARPASPAPDRPPETTDVLVVGGGTAGREAARCLAAAGSPPLVVERDRSDPGIAGIRWIGGATVVFLPPPEAEGRPFRAVAVDGRTSRLILARRVLVTTGGYDGPLLFPGNDRPGVMTADGAASMTGEGEAPPFRRALLFGGSARIATLLDRFGERVEAVAAPGSIHGDVAERAARLELPLYPRSLLVEATGRRRVDSVRFRTRGGGGAFSVDVDAIVLAHRRLPNPQLFFQAGARMEWRGGGGAYFPELTAAGTTTVPGLFAAGEAAGYFGDALATASGTAAAASILGAADPDPPLAGRPDAAVPNDLEGYYREYLALAGRPRKTVLCPCEDVLLHELEEASRRGFRGIEVIKRYTGAGTGLCQGRHCLPDVLLLLSILEQRPVPKVGYITQRPPVLPAALEALAGLPEGPTPPPEEAA